MGGTLPAAVRAVTAGEDRQRRGAAVLYGVNTLGAVLGALGSTFFALEFFGTRKTLWLACLVNLVTALSALALRRYAAGRGERVSEQQIARKAARTMNGRAASDQARPAPFPAHVIYVVAGIAGFSFFLMELVWYRMLGPILGGTTFTFGLILAVALTGIGLGGAAYAMFFRRAPLSLQASLLLASWRPAASRSPSPWVIAWRFWRPGLARANASHFLGEVGGWAVIAAIAILPAAFVSGVQFSLLVGLLGQGDKDVGKHLGFACGWNTVGAIAARWPAGSASCLCSPRRARGARSRPFWRSSAFPSSSTPGNRQDAAFGPSPPWVPRSSPPA